MAAMKLLNGPCDPRDVEMSVTPDAEYVSVRPMPYECQDIYRVTDRFVDDGRVIAATGEYLYTVGGRSQVDQYRRKLVSIGAGRAFRIKRERAH